MCNIGLPTYYIYQLTSRAFDDFFITATFRIISMKNESMKTTSHSDMYTTKPHQNEDVCENTRAQSFSFFSWLGTCMGQRNQPTKPHSSSTSSSRSRTKPKSKPKPRSKGKTKKVEHGWLSPNFGCDDSPTLGPNSSRSSLSTLALDDEVKAEVGPRHIERPKRVVCR